MPTKYISRFVRICEQTRLLPRTTMTSFYSRDSDCLLLGTNWPLNKTSRFALKGRVSSLFSCIYNANSQTKMNWIHLHVLAPRTAFHSSKAPIGCSKRGHSHIHFCLRWQRLLSIHNWWRYSTFLVAGLGLLRKYFPICHMILLQFFLEEFMFFPVGPVAQSV